MDGVGENPRFGEIGRGRFAPQHIDIRRIGKAAGDGRINAAAELVEAFGRAFPIN